MSFQTIRQTIAMSLLLVSVTCVGSTSHAQMNPEDIALREALHQIKNDEISAIVHCTDGFPEEGELLFGVVSLFSGTRGLRISGISILVFGSDYPGGPEHEREYTDGDIGSIESDNGAMLISTDDAVITSGSNFIIRLAFEVGVLGDVDEAASEDDQFHPDLTFYDLYHLELVYADNGAPVPRDRIRYIDCQAGDPGAGDEYQLPIRQPRRSNYLLDSGLP
jgi:hypothetical protein